MTLDGWAPITCEERERIVHGHTHGKLTVLSSITDPEGVYGPPLTYTEWGVADEDRPVLRDYLTYTYEGGPEKCAHYTQEKK